MKAAALVLAAAPVAGSGLMSLFLWFLLTFPWENSENDSTGLVTLLVFSVVGALVSGLAFFYSVARSCVRSAKAAFSIHAGLALIALAVALHASSHSDGRLIAFAGIVEACGACALALVAQHVTDCRNSVVKA